MIGLIQGRIASKTPPQLLVEAGGVGYEIEAPMSTFFLLPAIGEPVRLLTHLVVREDAHLLYGFATEEERRLFRNLLKVSGVGPRIALAILSGVSIDVFTQFVHAQDVAALTKIPGVGRKTAERLLVEMRDRLQEPLTPIADSGAPAGTPESEALHALVALGYKPVEATRLIKSVAGVSGSTEDLIRSALQNAGRN